MEELRNHYSIWDVASDMVISFNENLTFNELGVARNEIILLLKDSLEAGKNYSIKSFLTDDRHCTGRSTEQILQSKKYILTLFQTKLIIFIIKFFWIVSHKQTTTSTEKANSKNDIVSKI